VGLPADPCLQQELLESHQRFQALVQHSWDILSILDGEGRMVYNSPACEQIHGFKPEELLGKSTVDLIHPEDAPRVAETMGWILDHPREPATVEYRYACKDGRWVWMEAVGVNFLDHPAIRGIVANSRDISGRKRAEAALKASEAMFRQLLERQGEGFGMVDAEERFIFANPVADAIFGVPPGGLVGRCLLDFLEGPQRQQVRSETQERQSGRANTYELDIRRPDGEKRTLLVTATPRFKELSEDLQVIGVFRDITEARQAEHALLESEQKFHRLVEAASVPIGIVRATGQIEYLNPRFLQDFAYRLEDLPDMEAWWHRACPDPVYRLQVRQAWNEAQTLAPGRGGEIRVAHVFRVTCGNGRTRLVEIRGAMTGERVIVFLQDLTERIQTEERLRDTLELNERMVESQPLGVLAYHGASGRCVRANEAIARTINATLGQLLAQNFREIASWKPSGMLAAAERALATGSEQYLETQIQSSFGKQCWLSVFFSVFHTGGEAHLLVLCEDISARRNAEAALRKASAAVDQSPASIIITNTQGLIEYVNAAFTRITGYTFEEAVGRNPRFLKSGFHGPDFYSGLWSTVLAGLTWTGKLCNHRKDGRLYWEETTISPLRDDDGRITHFVATKLDITEAVEAAETHRRLEVQMARSQKLESLGSLAGGVAHDMNNVLGAILGLASVHQLVQPEGSALRRDMDTIVKACQRGGTLVKGLLGFARQGLAETQDVDLNSLVRDEVALLSRTTLQRVHLDMDLAEGLPLVRGDASALSHVLMNLCVNAVDAMEGGGLLTMRTFQPEAGFVGLEVSDTGCGMSKEVLEKALDPFFTTKPQGQGTGLGLPIVYGTVKAHQGRMEIDSAPGQGTRVSLFLPAIEAQAEAAPPPTPANGAQRRRLDVLVVDDDELVRDSLGQLLIALGHRPTLVESGEAALQSLTAEAGPDLVILDLNMPGLGGAATLPRIRELRPELPVLVVTGRVDQEALDLVQRVPRVGLMPKPFTLAEVRQHLEPYCGA
jgi:PAS domain S-box-containing protein